jgi:hypothetical protein
LAVSYFITGSNLQTHYVNTVGATVNDITPPVQGRAVVIGSVEFTEVSGGTPNVTLAIYDPKTPATYYKRNAAAVTANATVAYNEPFVLPNNWRLRITVSAGSCSVLVTYFSPNAAGQRT